MGPLGAMLIIAASITAFVLLVIFVMVPLFRVIGWLITAVFRGIGWLIMHVFQFVSGMIGDALRFVGSIIAMVVLVPLTMLNVIVGRWSGAGHFASSVKRECRVAGTCLYRMALQRPLRFVLLHGLLEGLEQRVPEAVAGAPAADRPRRATGRFDGYTIVGSLPGGGSGAKLYIAEPDHHRRRAGMPDRVVIKAFALTEGSSLPQIVRESRALECAKQLGLVLEHDMDEMRFFYVMPYHPGEHLGIITRQMHGEAGPGGLREPQVREVAGHIADLLAQLSVYHSGGLWHKDVKPENVIIHDGRAHLVDLGLVTPLRSAMTLTTHGTEYFRDPEMVRQALRGVKVHQVDGTKFDIYAVGAVLYFVLENTFPAHGGLSRFTGRSPESLRWIVKRAMAEYNQRYESVDAMLADLRTVMSAPDVYAVRPVDLPSMRGGAAAAALGPDPAPAPPAPVAPAAPIATPAAATPAAAMAAASIAAAGPAVARTIRPRLTVTNWWSGAYRVDDPGAVEAAPAPAAPAAAVATPAAAAFRSEARAFRRDVGAIRHQVRAGAMSARKAAREQIRTARSRARDVRRRAAAHRKAIATRRQPSAFLAFLVLVAIAFVVIATLAVTQSTQRGGWAVSGGPTTVIIEPSGVTLADPFGGLWGDGPALVVVDRQEDRDDVRVRQRLDEFVEKYRRSGYDVVADLDLPEIDDTFEAWLDDPQGPADEELEDLLEDHDFYGLLHVRTNPGHGPASKRAEASIVRSTRDGAKERRRLRSDAFVDSSLPLLLLNDHPAKSDPTVIARIDEIRELCRDRGWILIEDDETEVAVRRAWPASPFLPDQAPPPMLARAMADHELAGILLIEADPGEGPVADRITMRLIPAPALLGTD